VDDHEIFLQRGNDVRAVEVFVEDVTVEAPIGAKDDQNTFVRGRGGTERIFDFLFGIGGGGIEIFFRECLRPGCGARGWSEGDGGWMEEEQKKYEWKIVHKKPVSKRRFDCVNEKKGVKSPLTAYPLTRAGYLLGGRGGR
jgi:hypothetical protein